MKRAGRDLKRLSEVLVLKVLSSRLDGFGWTVLAERCGLSESTLSSSLRSLLGRGFVERVVDEQTRPPRVRYKLTESGFDELDAVDESEEEVLEGEPVFEAPDDLEEYFSNYFRLRGLAMDLGRGGVSLKRLFLTFGLLPILEVARAFVPTKNSDAYLKFLAGVYVNSVDPEALVDLPVEKGAEVVKFFWRLCSPNAHSCKEELLGFTFNYPKAFDGALKKLEKELKVKNKKPKQLLGKAFPYAKGEETFRRAVFARLKVISHPIRERRQVISKIWKKPENYKSDRVNHP